MARKAKTVDDLPQPKKEPIYEKGVIYDVDGKFPQKNGKPQKIELLSYNVGKLHNGIKVVREGTKKTMPNAKWRVVKL